jgi:hypothetical protein
MPASLAVLRAKANLNGSRCVGCGLGSWGTGRPLTV